MGRKIIFLILLILFAVPQKIFADTVPQISLSTLVTVQNVPFEECTRIFKMDMETLFYLTLASINANRFHIDEIQSKTGYILFNAVGKEFLASVAKLDNQTSLLKITPANNVYYFQPGIVLNTFRYIELNNNIKPVSLKINSNF